MVKQICFKRDNFWEHLYGAIFFLLLQNVTGLSLALLYEARLSQAAFFFFPKGKKENLLADKKRIKALWNL